MYTARARNNAFLFFSRIMMTEAYLDLEHMIRYYGEARVLETEQDDLSERSTISQMPLNFGLVSEFTKKEDVTPQKVPSFFLTYFFSLSQSFLFLL